MTVKTLKISEAENHIKLGMIVEVIDSFGHIVEKREVKQIGIEERGAEKSRYFKINHKGYWYYFSTLDSINSNWIINILSEGDA